VHGLIICLSVIWVRIFSVVITLFFVFRCGIIPSRAVLLANANLLHFLIKYCGGEVVVMTNETLVLNQVGDACIIHDEDGIMTNIP
jgi:hypothetical protein